MATYKTEEVVRSLDTAFEPDVFTLRIVKNEKRKSGSGNPMVVTETEVIDPPTAANRPPPLLRHDNLRA